MLFVSKVQMSGISNKTRPNSTRVYQSVDKIYISSLSIPLITRVPPIHFQSIEGGVFRNP